LPVSERSQTKKKNKEPKSMTHNPFQSYQTDPTLGAYAGFANPFTMPFTGMQTAGINPALNPLAAIQGSVFAQAGSPQLGPQGYTGVSNYPGLHPQQLAALQNPWIPTGLQNPWLSVALQNPLLNPILAQQLLSSGLAFGLQPHSPYQQIGAYGQQLSPYAQQPFGQQPFAQQPFAQQGLPYGQAASPFGQLGSPLTPQTFVGQAGPYGAGQPLGQIHPLLAQLGARQFLTPGIAPWAGF
jgi:hypothetical protein